MCIMYYFLVSSIEVETTAPVKTTPQMGRPF